MLKPMTLGARALVAACAGQSGTVAYAAPGYLANGPAACKIRETKTPHGVRLEALIHADRSVYGDYDFTITAYNKGGSSDISQAGLVDLVAGERATVGSAEIPRGRYRAVLTLSDARGPLCDLERRS